MVLKLLKWITLSIFGLVILTCLGLYFTDNGYLLKAIRVTYLTGHQTAFLNDYQHFDNRTISQAQLSPSLLL